jgi:hypothetical protein
MVFAPMAEAKGTKDALKAAGWLPETLKQRVACDEVAFPLADVAAAALLRC